MTAARNKIASARRTDPSPARLRKLIHTSGGRISGIRISHQGWPNVIDRFPTIADRSSKKSRSYRRNRCTR